MTTDFLEEQLPAGSDDMRQYLLEIRRFPRLTPEEERDLAKKCAEGEEWAIRKMVDCNLRLVVRVAWDYAGRGVPLMDLIQEGSIGLLVAAKKFDYTLDFRFSTYATKWIRQYVNRYIMNYGLIRIPVHTMEKIRKIQYAIKTLSMDSGVEPTAAQISKICGLSEDKVQELLHAEPEICSLDVSVGDGDDGTLGQLLENLQAEQPYEKLVRDELSHIIRDLVAGLDARQQQLLRLRFGMEDGTCYSLGQIGNVLGVSKERARQLEKQAIEKMRKAGSAVGLEDFLE